MRTLCLLGLTAVLMVAGCASQDGESFVLAGYDFSLTITFIVEISPHGYPSFPPSSKSQLAILVFPLVPVIPIIWRSFSGRP